MTSERRTAAPTGPLVGLKVLELGSLIAGPFAGRLFADFGATVIKVEPPDGDPLRSWSLVTEHGSLWSLVQSRNKHSVVADLRVPEGQAIARSLAKDCDVLIENFRPGRMERWGLGFDDLEAINPGLVMVRISGYGQTGPSAQKPGFGNIAEAIGGIRYITGWSDGPPLRVGLSLADSIAALYAINGALMALHERQSSGRGQVVDVALTEAVFSMLEAIVPEFGFDGRVRERSGNTLNGAAPSNVYRTGDERYLAIGANGDSIFARLAAAMGAPELARDPRFRSNQSRRNHVAELDTIIETWVQGLTLDQVQSALDEQSVPAGPVYSISDIVADEQFRARDMIVDVPHGGLGSVMMPGIVPRLDRTPGAIRWAGPSVGADRDLVARHRFASDGVSGGGRFDVGMFDWLDVDGAGGLAEGYRRRFELVERVEELGFYAYQVAEHHGTPLSVAPSASVLLAALAQRTSTIRLCPLVYLLPMHDPLRLVEEICMVDHLCDGRLEVGVGRGASPYELEIFGVAVADSRAMFEESLEVIVQGLGTGHIDYHGKFYSYDDVVVPVSPRQKPYPPLWYPTISPASVPWIAEHGLNTVYGFGFLSPTLEDTAAQRKVFDTVRAEHAGSAERINGHVADPKFGLMRQIYISDSDSDAIEQGRKAFEYFYRSFGYLWAKHDNDRFPRNPSFDDYVADGLVLCGSPDSVRDTLVHTIEVTGADYFTGAFAFGDLPIERVHRSLNLFHTEIRPALDHIAHQRTTTESPPV